MRKLLSYFKPFDYIFITLAIILSFIPTIITSVRFANMNSDQAAVGIVKIHGKVVDEFVLEEGADRILKTYYPGENQYNIVEVQDQQIRIKEDNSPDQIGVNTGWISRPGQTAICLPHGFLIEVTGKIAEDELVLPL